MDDITFALADGSPLHWNGSEYRIKDTHGQHSYQYLLEFTDVQEVPGGWNYTNEYVLTDDPGLTLEDFRRSGGGKTVYSGGSTSIFDSENILGMYGRGYYNNAILADPLFKDVENRDFTLAENSPALETGFVPFEYDAGALTKFK